MHLAASTARLFARMLFLLGAEAIGIAAAGPPGIDLTPAERGWVRENPVVTVGFSPAYAPFSMPAGDGRMEGIDLDYLALISRRTGLIFKPVVLADWPAVEQEFKAGKLDVLTGLVGSTAQRQSMLLTQSYLKTPVVIVTRIDSPYLLQPSDLKGLRVGAARGYTPADKSLRPMTEQATLVEYDNMEEVFKALSRGEIEATVVEAINAAYTIKSQHLANLRLGSVVEGPSDLFFGVTRRAPLLAAVMGKAIADITTEERREIDDRWVALEARPSPWILAFRVAVIAVGIIALISIALYWHQRRLRVELLERRRVQQELELAHERLGRMSEQKSELLRMIAHDIRSPLAGLMLTTDPAVFSREDGAPELRAALDRVQSITQRLARLVDDLVDVQLVEDGRRVYHFAALDMAALVTEAVASVAPATASKRIRVTVRSASPSTDFVSDAAALRQVIGNLLSNAVKYTLPGTEVTVETRIGPAGLRLAISDQGPGLSATDAARIFRPYGRGAAAPTGGEKSLGLGLWIVSRIVSDLRGLVRCENTEGGGAAFIVELPPGSAPG